MPKSPAKTKQELLAQEIAQAFQDTDQVRLYLISCKKYPLAIIHRAFAEARSIPEERIKKSRPAVFFYLVKKYAHERNENPRH